MAQKAPAPCASPAKKTKVIRDVSAGAERNKPCKACVRRIANFSTHRYYNQSGEIPPLGLLSGPRLTRCCTPRGNSAAYRQLGNEAIRRINAGYRAGSAPAAPAAPAAGAMLTPGQAASLVEFVGRLVTVGEELLALLRVRFPAPPSPLVDIMSFPGRAPRPRGGSNASDNGAGFERDLAYAGPLWVTASPKRYS
ncbi:hypothetical protein MKZ38_005442 [Zalerion maritima]|uniref:Uncharacterized protein n=1 Tax=Zalerion maritima TaxID=339359 RepID=A0AAD5WQC5_9PEZI|nr:hypothetical protein MKZ38_005442 [Zalerion maritima]